MFVFMEMFMRVRMRMIVRMLHPPVSVFMHMSVIMLMCVQMLVFMCSVHFKISFRRVSALHGHIVKKQYNTGCSALSRIFCMTAHFFSLTPGAVSSNNDVLSLLKIIGSRTAGSENSNIE